MSVFSDSNHRIALAALAVVAAGCSSPESSFTQMEGFDKIRASQPARLPAPDEQALLEKHRPVLYAAAGQEGPLDFYQDYIAQGCLRIDDEQDCQVTQADLNRARDDLLATFTHIPAATPTTATGYGSVYRGTVQLPGLEPPQREWTFLRYHFAFRHSGIATGVSWLQAALLDLAGDLDDWHQLDHYTSVVVVLDETQEPVAVMLQQHNYMHTYLVGVEPAFPTDGPFRVDIAKRSNEFYPHRPQPATHPAASFIAEDNVDWLAGVVDSPPGGLSTATSDGTWPDREISYRLAFLPANDAFYIFVGRLGEKRILPGSDGPPGAIYYTLPQLVPYEISLPMFYWQTPDEQFAKDFKQFDFRDPLVLLETQQRRLTEALVANGLVR